jgi:hypothetical protein
MVGQQHGFWRVVRLHTRLFAGLFLIASGHDFVNDSNFEFL